jgi:protein SCO1/2
MRRIFSMICLALPLLFCSCGPRHSLGDYGTVTDFDLISQMGRKTNLADLRGKVWVADTFFTTCTGPCPMMSARLQKVAREVAAIPNVRVVSFTVDPDHDTPQALLEYAGHFHASPDRWLFLTGAQPVLNRVSQDGLRLAPVDGSLDHSTRFVLVDGRARIRGYYSPFEQPQFDRLIADIRFLAGL